MNLGNILENLKNPDLVVDLTESWLEELSEDSHKPFLDTVIMDNWSSYIDFLYNILQCGCDVKRYLTPYLAYPGILRNASCDGPSHIPYENEEGEVMDINMLDLPFFEQNCPSEECQNYDAGKYAFSFSQHIMSK